MSTPSERQQLRQQLISYCDGPVQDQRIQAHALTTAYLQAGEGPPLILLHGANSDGTLWFPVIGKLAEQFTVYAPDLPGYGESDKSKAAYDLAFFTDWLRDFITALGQPHAHVCGISKGGFIATALAIHQPDVIDKLVLVDPGGFGKLQMPFLQALAIHWMHMRPTEKSQARVTGYSEAAIQHNPKLQTMRRYRLLTMQDDYGTRAYFRSLRWVTNVFSDAELRQVSVPALLVWGEDDPVLPAEYGQRGVQLIPDARLELIPGAGHVPFWDDAEAFSAAVRRFLGEG